MGEILGAASERPFENRVSSVAATVPLRPESRRIHDNEAPDTPDPIAQSPSVCTPDGGGYPSCQAREPVSSIAYLKVPIPLDMPLADNLPAAVDEVKFAEFVVLVFEINGPIATSGSGGIGAPG